MINIRPRKNRKFDYTPQFYKPEEGKGGSRDRIKFRRLSEHYRQKSRNNIYKLILLLAAIAWLYAYLSQKF